MTDGDRRLESAARRMLEYYCELLQCAAARERLGDLCNVPADMTTKEAASLLLLRYSRRSFFPQVVAAEVWSQARRGWTIMMIVSISQQLAAGYCVIAARRCR